MNEFIFAEWWATSLVFFFIAISLGGFVLSVTGIVKHAMDIVAAIMFLMMISLLFPWQVILIIHGLITGNYDMLTFLVLAIPGGYFFFKMLPTVVEIVRGGL